MNETIKDVCKIGQGSDCCKYLLLSPEGFMCGKSNTETKAMVDKSWAETEHVAQGDNCEGEESLNTK